jgi:hypothetical protein
VQFRRTRWNELKNLLLAVPKMVVLGIVMSKAKKAEEEKKKKYYYYGKTEKKAKEVKK